MENMRLANTTQKCGMKLQIKKKYQTNVQQKKKMSHWKNKEAELLTAWRVSFSQNEVLNSVIALGRQHFLYLSLWQRRTSATCPEVGGEDGQGYQG